MSQSGIRVEDLAAGNEAIVRLLAAEQAAGLLRAAIRRGLLAAAGPLRTVAEIASLLDIATGMAAEVCASLHEWGILDREADRFRLSPGLQALTHPDAPQQLENTLRLSQEYVGLLERSLGTGTVDQPPRTRLAIASAVWGRASSPVALASFAAADAQMPEVRSLWQSGARHMELGCGAGRDLLRIAVPYPNTSVLGVDVDAGVLAEVMRQAIELGIADRVAVHLGDASGLGEIGAFDTILWSQMFFAAAIRPATIAVIRRSLKPGGFLLMPLLRARPSIEQARQSPGARQTGLSKVLWQSWGLDWMLPDEVQAELEREGFGYVRTVPHARTAYMLMQG